MIPGAAISAGVQGLVGIAGGIIGSGARKREQRAAQAEFNAAKQNMMNLDTSNLAANLENTYEDLTVNQQQYQMQNQANQASLANTMAGMQGAAGGGGIAALAQAMAGQQAQQNQAAAAAIGQQEAQNQMAAAQGAAKIQAAELAGAQQARGLEYQKGSFMMNQAGQRLSAANAARAQATQSIMSGIGALGAGAGEYMDAQNAVG
tara:strand:+ start:8799 stop:9413 length:615 start_codon:yes stop_codon:yes gene_type:complete